MAERAVRSAMVIVETPSLDDCGIHERGELMHVQTLITQAAVKGLNEGISTGYPK
jgi:hypothetical protein